MDFFNFPFCRVVWAVGGTALRGQVHGCRFVVISFLVLCGSMWGQAKYSPPVGCYPGAFIVNDPVVAGNVAQFELLTGKKHASYFSYASWGQQFPSDWVNYYAAGGAVVQIAFEPNNGLAEVTDGSYIREWARAARKSGAMILLRWACEMNGSWVAWYGNPQLYIEKWKLITTIMRQEAPNVAMVWAPNDVPNVPNDPPNYIHAYYPGDNWVDWVGIDFYCVYYYENGMPERKDPRRKLDEVYTVYANRKPVIICEWAATHYSARVSPPVDCTPYSVAMMDSLYRNLAVQYPKVKSVNWFSMNSLTQNKCNYSLTVNQSVLNAYKANLNNSYFLSSGFRNVPWVQLPGLRQDSVIRAATVINAQVACDRPIDTVLFYLDSTLIASLTAPPYRAELNPAFVPDGFHTVRVAARSADGYWNYEETRVVIDKAHRYSMSIIDDSVSSVFSVAGPWSVSTSQPDRYGAYYHAAPAGNGSAVAVWRFSVPEPGWYTVSAFWSQHSNRASRAPYVIVAQSGTDTVKVSQQVNGGRWNLLASRYLQPGALVVELNNQADGYVIADAVKLEYAFLSGIDESNAAGSTKEFSVSVYPNPASGVVTVWYTLKEPGKDCRISVIDMLGREVWAAPADQSGGNIIVNMQAMASGAYSAILSASGRQKASKFILVK